MTIESARSSSTAGYVTIATADTNGSTASEAPHTSVPAPAPVPVLGLPSAHAAEAAAGWDRGSDVDDAPTGWKWIGAEGGTE